jgi:hypothetical protein
VSRALREAESNDDKALFLQELASIGVTAEEAERVAVEALALVEAMADRDRKADVFHAAVRAAGHGERRMGERVAAIARQLRQKLGPTAPALADFGVPPELPAEERPRPRPDASPGPLWSAANPNESPRRRGE